MDHPGGEVGAVDGRHGAVLQRLVGGTVLLVKGEVDHIEGQAGMQLARLAPVIDPVPVVDPVGDIGGLLDLGQQHPRTDGVDPPGGHEVDIAGRDGLVMEDLLQGPLVEMFQVGLPVHLPVEPGDQLSAIRLHDIPHLGLPEGVMPFAGGFIVGMHLDAEEVTGVDELDQQGKLDPEPVEHLIAQKVAHINLGQFLQVVSCQEAVL